VTPTRPSLGFAPALLRYYRDPSASIFGKLIVFGAIAYAVMPLDLIPDVPIIGWLDDLGIMSLAMAWLTHVARRYQFAQSTAPTLHP
jgi:uncharacterized membrane protein YkvA (DUF1232 family)